MFKRIHTKSIIITWFISYMIILLFSLLINLYIYIKVDSTLMEHVIKSNLEVLHNKKLSIDNTIRSTIVRGIEIADNDKVKEISQYKNPLTETEKYALTTVFNNLSMYRSRELNIIDTYIYFHKIDYVSTPISGAASEQFFNALYGNNGISYANWNEILHKRYKGQFVNLNKNNSLVNKSNVVYLKSVVRIGEDQPETTIAIEIDFKNILKDNDKDRNLLIIDANNKVFLSSFEKDLNAIVNNADFSRNDEVKNVNINGNEFVLLQIKSDELGWKYMYAINKSNFMIDINQIRWFIFISIVVFILFGILLAWYFVKRNHKPIENIMAKIKVDKNTNLLTDELKYIENVISKTIEENNKYNMRHELQDKVIRNAILTKLLNNDIDGNASIQELLYSVNVKFEHDSFVVLMFYIEQLENMFFDHNNKDTIENFKLSKLVISNILQEMFLGKYTLLNCESDDFLVTIINSDKLNNIEEMTQTLEIAQKFILDNFNIEFVVAISNTHTTIYGIPQCYQEALQCMEYKFVITNNIIKYDDVKEPINTTYYFPLEKEEQMINCLKAGEYEKGMVILNEIFDINLSNKKVSIDLIRCLVYDIAGTMAKILNDVGELENGEFLTDLSMFVRINKCNTVILIKEEMSSIFKEFCEKNINENGNKLVKLINSVAMYINDSYQNHDISVSTIAVHFNINASYLSSVFKKQKDIGLLEYITRLRLEKAKDILKNTDKTIDDVSMMVGYLNSRTFSRLFIKHVGISPGKYRSISES